MKIITGDEPAMPTEDFKFLTEPGKTTSTCVIVNKGGLTIRQQFAMAAMQGYISAGSTGMPDPYTIAALSVDAADKLIAELNKPKP